jgi:hypothetical protein
MSRLRLRSVFDAGLWHADVDSTAFTRHTGETISALGIESATALLDQWVKHMPSRRAYTYGGDPEDGSAHSLVLAWWGQTPSGMAVSISCWDTIEDYELYALDGLPFALDIERLVEVAAPLDEPDGE